ncbi:unnamed protein product [Rotaria sp. Silwood2]|nr:unnamed protein product [Rotaria sp. Silwood2]CAF4428129.1 unnamed protein product [Rotaria sp. Silwood2]CAF4435898.1 unnamed protein product [Rotaria sp. Silwood2]CAF4524131.1 unnamed protein product [Rotaria sp. Silwood2]
MSPTVFLERHKIDTTDRRSTSSHRFLTGRDVLLNERTDKGTAFTIEERQLLRIHGLLPPSIATIDLQVERFMENLRHMPDDLSRYISLLALQDRNETLFYRVITQHTQETMPLVYTPTVGLACQKGLFLSIHDKGHIYDTIINWPENDIRAIVVTDGERILGLGDLGCNGMGIPVGKLSLYTALAGVPPQYCLPMMLDVGTNNEVTEYLLIAYIYIYMLSKWFRRSSTINTIWGCDKSVLPNHNAFRMLAKYRNEYCTFNDDIQGTASVAVAGILSSIRITQRKLADNTFVFYGAGEASIGAAGKGPAFTREILKKMASFNKHPVIFALSNPTSKAECTAQEAYEATNGQCVFASGSPFPNVEYQGKTYVSGQGNNSYIFPGVALAVVTCRIRHIPEEIFYIAAKTLSDLVTEEDLAIGLVYPSIEKIRDVSRSIAVKLADYAFDNNLASLYPKPNDMDEFIKSNQYTAEYHEILPRQWDWPKMN